MPDYLARLCEQLEDYREENLRLKQEIARLKEKLGYCLTGKFSVTHLTKG